MSDILIRGMEMPTTGLYFVSVDNTCGRDKTVVTVERMLGNRDVRQIVGSFKLVPVPPHGDLIDKDATMNEILEQRGEDTACWFAGIVNDMTAIIPSDKAEEGET